MVSGRVFLTLPTSVARKSSKGTIMDARVIKNASNETIHKRSKVESEKVEALCQKLDIPNPHDVYIIPRVYDIAVSPIITQFSTNIPEGLKKWVTETEFEFTVTQINSYLLNAERVKCTTVLSGLCRFVTCYVVRICKKSDMEKALLKVKAFILQQNHDIYHPKGLHIVDPVVRGLRQLEFKSIVTFEAMDSFMKQEQAKSAVAGLD